MALYGWKNCPPLVQRQLDQSVHEIQTTLADNLIGIYLHGSLALGSFNPDASDIDLLVVTQHSMSLATKRRIAELLLQRSQQPRPIEISFLGQADLRPWRHPAPFDLHYSEMWRAGYERDLAGEGWRTWNDTQRYDPDLAAHVTIVSHRGIGLAGAPIADVFPAVPRRDYLASAIEDVLGALGTIADEPAYAILNACRTQAYLHDGAIRSKAEGGEWALRELPPEHRPPVAMALALYSGERPVMSVDPALLEDFAEYMRAALARLTG
jgi:streptomycin 3"-adenylyltransferase